MACKLLQRLCNKMNHALKVDTGGMFCIAECHTRESVNKAYIACLLRQLFHVNFLFLNHSLRHMFSLLFNFNFVIYIYREISLAPYNYIN